LSEERTDSCIIIELILIIIDNIMTNKILKLVFLLLVFLTSACVKETYNMDKLSTKAHLTPTMALAAIRGDISFSDMVKSVDSVVIDQEKFVKLIFRKDSIIDVKLADFYDLTNMVSFSQSYTIGELTIAPFSLAMKYSVSPVTALISPTPKAIPSFGSVNLGEQVFSFPNFQNAVFSSGSLNITILNNLPADLNQISLRLYSGSGSSRTLFVPFITIPAIPKGTSQTYSVNLANRTLLNPISAAIVLSGSPGNSTPVLITQNNSNVQVTISGSALKVKSGTVIIPSQAISSLDNKDTISFDPGSGIELDEMKITTGNVTYHMQSSSRIPATVNITMPSALRNGTPVSEVINVGAVSSFNGTISFNNTVVDLGTIATQPYNSVPFTYGISVNSNNAMVTFNSTDAITFDLKLQNPVFDYVKGYFGQTTETVDPDSIDLNIADILSNMSGEFLVSSPSIRLNYKNSFAIPMVFTLNATGKRGTKTVNLGLAPLTIASPAAPAIRDASGTITIDKSNSSLPQLISMPPEVIRFSGSAKMNSAGDPAHLRNNYVFGNSRFLGSLEVEVPMEMQFNNIQFSDTVDNFLKDKNGDSQFNFENFGLFRVDLAVNNGFPFGFQTSMCLYNSTTGDTTGTLKDKKWLSPAPVDVNGLATGKTESKTSIEFTRKFFESVNKSDKIIISFKLNSTDNKVVKIFSDYNIEFKAALVVNPDINLK
jgi:hypothetical protein